VCAAGSGIWLVLALSACGAGDPVVVPEAPSQEQLGLTSEETERYAAIGFDKLVEALEVAGDDDDAVEIVIERVNGKVVGWAGIVQSRRLVRNGPTNSEFSLSVAPAGQVGKAFPKALPVLFEVPNEDPVAAMEAGDPIVFVGRLEFDGRTREPWVLDSRRLDSPAAP
jgi:hypothetical protein